MPPSLLSGVLGDEAFDPWKTNSILQLASEQQPSESQVWKDEVMNVASTADGFSRLARSPISDEVLEALRSADRKGRDVVVGLSNACCKWGCSKSEISSLCWTKLPLYNISSFLLPRAELCCFPPWSLQFLIPLLLQMASNSSMCWLSCKNGLVCAQKHLFNVLVKNWYMTVNKAVWSWFGGLCFLCVCFLKDCNISCWQNIDLVIELVPEVDWYAVPALLHFTVWSTASFVWSTGTPQMHLVFFMPLSRSGTATNKILYLRHN